MPSLGPPFLGEKRFRAHRWFGVRFRRATLRELPLGAEVKLSVWLELQAGDYVILEGPAGSWRIILDSASPIAEMELPFSADPGNNGSDLTMRFMNAGPTVLLRFACSAGELIDDREYLLKLTGHK